MEESKLVYSLVNKAQRWHKAILISQGFNPYIGDLGTFVESCKQVEITENIAVAKFYASYEDSETNRHNKRSKFKERK